MRIWPGEKIGSIRVVRMLKTKFVFGRRHLGIVPDWGTKALEIDWGWDSDFYSWFNIRSAWTRKGDHWGLRFEFSLGPFEFELDFYDGRHWNYKENRPYLPGEEENDDDGWLTAEKRTGYMDLTDFMFELGEALGGRKIYSSIEDLTENQPCAKRCGIVKVDIYEDKIIQPSWWSKRKGSYGKRETEGEQE